MDFLNKTLTYLAIGLEEFSYSSAFFALGKFEVFIPRRMIRKDSQHLLELFFSIFKIFFININ